MFEVINPRKCETRDFFVWTNKANVSDIYRVYQYTLHLSLYLPGGFSYLFFYIITQSQQSIRCGKQEIIRFLVFVYFNVVDKQNKSS